MQTYIGEIAALGTSICFAITATLFTLGARQVGAPIINRSRLLVSIVFVVGIHWILQGEPFPSQIEPWRWSILGISGIIGLALGDASLFQSFVMVGPRIGMLMMSLAPVLSTILAWLFLGEILSIQELLGITITVLGIAWVVSEQTPENNTHDKHNPRIYLYGLLFAFGGALGQALGLLTSKIGLQDDFPPLSGNLIRILFAVILIWTFTTFRGQTVQGFRKLRQHPQATRLMVLGSLSGPVLGVWLSLIAAQQASSLGVASTLMSLTPIFLLPIGYVVFHERISSRAVVGTVLSFIGVVLLLV